jgi:hypothetical protein
MTWTGRSIGVPAGLREAGGPQLTAQPGEAAGAAPSRCGMAQGNVSAFTATSLIASDVARTRIFPPWRAALVAGRTCRGRGQAPTAFDQGKHHERHPASDHTGPSTRHR